MNNRLAANLPTRHDPYPVHSAYHGIYAHGVSADANLRTLYISGQTPESRDGKVAKDFKTQCRTALENLEQVLADAEMTFQDIVKMNFYLTRRQDMDDLVLVRKELLDGVRPAITTLYVAGLVSSSWLVEVEAVACAQHSKSGALYSRIL